LGPLLALELVTSFYGCFIAYVIFAPLAKRLKFMNMEEVSRREILIEGLTYIQQGINPKVISEELFSYMNVDRNAKAETQKETQQQHAPLKAKEVL
jgi:chemotaxis protein MotA